MRGDSTGASTLWPHPRSHARRRSGAGGFPGPGRPEGWLHEILARGGLILARDFCTPRLVRVKNDDSVRLSDNYRASVRDQGRIGKELGLMAADEVSLRSGVDVEGGSAGSGAALRANAPEPHRQLRSRPDEHGATPSAGTG